MRYADINLTMSKYTHVLRGQEHEAVAKLPDLSPGFQSQRATGTDGQGVTRDFDLAENLAFLGAEVCSPMQPSSETAPTGAIKNGDSNTPERIRTPNLRFRRPTLYPIELQAPDKALAYCATTVLSTPNHRLLSKTVRSFQALLRHRGQIVATDTET